MLFEFVSSGPWYHLKDIILAEARIDHLNNVPFFQRWLQDKATDSETVLVRLADRLLQLPRLASIRYRWSLYPNASHAGSITSLVNCGREPYTVEKMPPCRRQYSLAAGERAG